MPSAATRLEQYESEFIAEQNQRSLPVAGSKLQISYGTAKTRSVRFWSTSTSTGVPHVPLKPAASFRQTSLPVSVSSATKASLSADAVTISKFLYKMGLDAEPQPRGSDSVPS